MIYNNFQSAYIDIVNDVYKTGKDVTVRGLEMKEKIPYYFEISNPRDRLLNIESRKNINKYIFGELMWYLSGRDDVEFISKYSKVWAPLSDDGIHSNSAYGKYIFREMPTKGWGTGYYDDINMTFKSQWNYVKETLTRDPYSRQAVIQIKPIQMYDTKDVTCTYFLQFFIRDNKLDMLVGMRSNDLLFGTTYDVFMFTFMQELMAAELGVELGTYKHFAANMHIYVRDRDKIEAICKDSSSANTFKFAQIPADFRINDLPKLLELEKQYWSNDKQLDIDLINSLSTLGKQILSLLTKEQY
jgi:thymidylate synthase